MKKHSVDKNNLLFSNKALVALLIPIVVEQLLNSFMGMIDTMMVSNVGSEALSGVSLVDSVNNLIVQLFSAMATGAAIVCSHYVGMRDKEGANNAAKQVVISVGVIALVITVFGIIFKRQNYIKNFSNKYLQDENMWEFETLSIFLSNNPFKDIYEKLTNFEDVEENNNCVIVGVISKIEKKKDRRKKQYAFITVYSACGIIETICWSNVFSIYQDKLKKGDKVAFLVAKEDGKAIVKKIKSFKKWKHDVGL